MDFKRQNMSKFYVSGQKMSIISVYNVEMLRFRSLNVNILGFKGQNMSKFYVSGLKYQYFGFLTSKYVEI